MSTRSRLSVVIPVHDGMPHLPATLASVLGQTRPADEVIVLENGSTDGTAEWLVAHAPAGVRVVTQDRLVDAATNWSDAIRHTTGDLVKLVCADDVLEPNALEVQGAQLESHPRAVMAAAMRKVVDDDGRVVVARRGLTTLRGEIDGRTAVRRCVLVGSNLLGEPSAVMFRRDALVAHLPWDGSLGYVIDVDMYSKVLQEGTLVVTRAPLARFRMAHGSWSSSLSDVQARHIDGWVDRVRTAGLADLSRVDLAVSRVGVRVQDLLRKTAYVVTAWTRRGTSAPATTDA
ncbi:glycosyltransferase family 2 protein [Cellulomonas shaoxiangyii]|uniref:Glycosyltransferase family 2 protein n=1 Tax=Cellulomonas shaoxiangyii TaxID=2566013 RepID=A0A4P7SKR5_9CELL|nr:glycosyltransferase family 2 protein [Cellulomonas shaoxiangyii]QCB93133.1 glycosyltransferase family 2 protein [Cellulomonas shaoxiangyii]TGY84792.1 glycosyltransferase family 2 protein [Cellulomonas shaoxiangyii]